MLYAGQQYSTSVTSRGSDGIWQQQRQSKSYTHLLQPHSILAMHCYIGCLLSKCNGYSKYRTVTSAWSTALWNWPCAWVENIVRSYPSSEWRVSEPPSGRRLKVPLAKKNLFKKSFISFAMLILSATFLFTVYFFYSIHLFPCTDLSYLIYLPILVHIINVTTLCLIYLPMLVHIINVTTLCLIKEHFKIYYLLMHWFIYYLEYIFIYI